MPSVLAIALHLGTIIKTIKDLEQGLADIIAKKATPEEAKSILTDIMNLVGSGLINIPGLTADEIQQVITDVSKVL